jgi:hypothetical protein
MLRKILCGHQTSKSVLENQVVFFSSFASQVWHPSYRSCALPRLNIPDLGRVLQRHPGILDTVLGQIKVITKLPNSEQTETVSGLMEGSTEVLGHNASQNTLWSPNIQIKQSKLNTETENEPSDIIPPHLRDMYDRAIKGLNPEERKKLKSLLIEYQDVFAKRPIINSTVIHTPPDCTIFLSDQDWS